MAKTKKVRRHVKSGKFSVTRSSNNVIKIELHDGDGRRQLFEVIVTAENLGLAITGLACVPCEFSILEVEE